MSNNSSHLGLVGKTIFFNDMHNNKKVTLAEEGRKPLRAALGGSSLPTISLQPVATAAEVAAILLRTEDYFIIEKVEDSKVMGTIGDWWGGWEPLLNIEKDQIVTVTFAQEVRPGYVWAQPHKDMFGFEQRGGLVAIDNIRPVPPPRKRRN